MVQALSGKAKVGGEWCRGRGLCCSPLVGYPISKKRSGRAAPYQAQPLVGVSVQVRVGWP